MTLGGIALLGLLVFVAGMAGGFIDAWRHRNTSLGQESPKEIPAGAPVKVSEAELKKPGILYNMVIGGAAALLSWALYGPLAQINLLNLGEETANYAMTLAAVGGAVFVGMSGARWISAEAEKRILQTGVTIGLASPESPDAAEKVSVAGSETTVYNAAVDAYKGVTP